MPASLIIHGTNDNTVPFSQGEELYEKLNSFGNDVELIAIDGADHADELLSGRNLVRNPIVF